SLTVAAWIKLGGANGGAPRTIFSNWDGTCGPESGGLSMTVRDSNELLLKWPRPNGGCTQMTARVPLREGKWMHVAASVNDSRAVLHAQGSVIGVYAGSMGGGASSTHP
ncbi:unnamed protein product, partial [Chrysoparadoxa australica]